MTNDEVHEALVRWIAKITGRTTIKAYQKTKSPALDYVMVNFTGMSEVREHAQLIEYSEAGTGDIDTGDEFPDVTATPVIETEWRFSVHAYGSSPTDILRPIVSAQKLSQVTEPLLPGLILFELSQIRHVPEFINNAWEFRAQIDIFLRGLTRDGHVIDVIEEAVFVHERRA